MQASLSSIPVEWTWKPPQLSCPKEMLSLYRYSQTNLLGIFQGLLLSSSGRTSRGLALHHAAKSILVGFNVAQKRKALRSAKTYQAAMYIFLSNEGLDGVVSIALHAR